MKTDLLNKSNKRVFLQTVGIALRNLKQRLQHDYERAYPDYPDLHHLIRIVVDAEEARARGLAITGNVRLLRGLRPIEPTPATRAAPGR